MRNISYLLAILFVWAYAFSGCKGKKEQTQTTTEPPVAVVDTTPKVVETPPVDTLTVMDKAEITAIKEENNLKKDQFYVIGGSFKEKQRADGFSSTLQKKGYEALVLKPHKTFNRVAIQAYENEANARIALEKLRKEFNDVSFWLLMPN